MAPSPVVWDDGVGSLDIGALSLAYREGTLTPVDVVDAVYDRIAALGDPAVFISLVPREAAIAAAAALGAWDASRPLWGVPFAVKDNIDVAGVPTTVASPAAAFVPDADAPAVAALKDAGAIVVGKTNLDQWATGLNGTRSPYGTPRNPYDAAVIPGGSSSGSGVAVGAGLVSFALGTDTAGSGRVPAALNGVVGLKPSRGLVSARGVYPACASLDCVSVFALSVADAALVASCYDGVDLDDPYSRPLPRVAASAAHPAALAGRVFAVPAGVAHDLFSDDARDAWARSCAALTAAGVELRELDLSAFYRAGGMLYGGAWLAERHAALAPWLGHIPDAVEPTVRAIVSPGAAVSAGEVFASLRELEGMRRDARAALAGVDALLCPTIPGAVTVDAMLADPVTLNQRLGRFTTFTNLLDLAAIAVPAGMQGSVPFGLTVQAPAGSDGQLAALAAAIEALDAMGPRNEGPRGQAEASGPGAAHVQAEARGRVQAAAGPGEVELAVVGAHLRGQPLHSQLMALGARFVREARTSAAYRLYALDTTPPKPGLVRSAAGGAPQAVEVYAVPEAGLGRLLAGIPAPLGLGQVTLDDGSSSVGFLCEAVATAGALDITGAGGWRAHLASVREGAS